MTAKKDSNLSKQEALILAWKKRTDYKGYDKSKGSSFNSWRSIVYTKKGRNIGFPDKWHDYNVFMKEVQGKWKKGKIAIRIDVKKPHSHENTFWADKGSENVSKLIKFEYNGVIKTLLEWSRDLHINYNGLRLRYFRHKDWSAEEILFGKKIKPRDSSSKSYEHRIMRMCAAYKLTDKKRGLSNNINYNFMIDMCKNPCFYCGDTEKIGLDRIDNSKGHTIDNVVPCCYMCNCARMDNFTHEEMIVLGKTIREIKQKRNTN